MGNLTHLTCKELKLHCTKYKEAVTLVDNDDFSLLSQFKWYLDKGGYAFRTEYLGMKGKKTKNQGVKLHRFLLNAPKELEVDHINGNRLDNRKSNLRLCTSMQNSQNRFNSQRKNTNIPIGVGKFRNVWRARITVGKKEIHLGCFNTLLEAKKVREKAAKKYFGEFARI